MPPFFKRISKPIWFLILFGLFIFVVAVPAASNGIAFGVRSISGIDLTGFFDTLRGQLASLVLVFLVSLFVELRDRKELIKLDGEDIALSKRNLLDLIRSLNANQMMSIVAPKLLGEKLNAENFVRSIFPDKPSYTEAKLYLRLQRTSKNEFVYEYSCDFLLNKQNLVIALTNRPDLQDKLFNLTGVDEIACHSSLSDLSSNTVDTFCLQFSCLQLSRNAQGYLHQENRPLRICENFDTNGHLSPEELNNVVFLIAELQGKSPSHRILMRYPKQAYSLSTPYIYWLSDRTLHIDSIEIDGRDFFGDSPKGHINIQTNIADFSPNQKLRGITADAMPVRLPIDAWLSYGQGIIISWRDMDVDI